MPVDKFGRMSDTKTMDTGVSLTYINNNYIRSDGGTPVTGSINMGGNTLYNVSNPENIQDVATKKYVDNLIAENVGKGNRSGGGSPFFKENDNFKATHTIDMRFKKLLNLFVPSEPSDAATKKYADNIKSVLNESINSLSQEINKIQEEFNEKIDDVLRDVPDPVNPQDVVTKEYADKISSLFNASILKLTQLYITLSSSQDENKEEIKKINETRREINEKINETRQEIYGKINEAQLENTKRLKNILRLVKGSGGLLTIIAASFVGDLKKDEYQFSYSPSHDLLYNGWSTIPYYGKVEHLVLKTPYNYKERKNILDRVAKSDYTTIIRPFL